MESCNVAALAPLAHASPKTIRDTLSSEAKFEVTKSLVNLLYNIVVVGSVRVNDDTKSFIDRRVELVLALVSRSKPLWWKQQQLIHNPALVRTIVQACPDAV